MKKLLFGLLALLMLAVPAVAQQNVNAGQYLATPPTLIDTQRLPLQTDTRGNLKVLLYDAAGVALTYNPNGQATMANSAPVVIASDQTGVPIAGSVADAAAASGNPVPVGGMQNTTLPTYGNGARTTAQYDTRGGQYVVIKANAATAAANVNAPADGSSNSSAALYAWAENAFYNGSTWDRGFTCANSAVVNVTAAATTQLVALASSQIIRVCSVAITMSAAGTAKFVYGTGSNCGTGTTDITGAFTLATGTPLTLSGMNGSVFRTIASNALCLTAVTGNVTGVISYAQF